MHGQPTHSENVTATASPQSLPDVLTRVGGVPDTSPTGTIVEVISGQINYTLGDATLTPGVNDHKLNTGDLIELSAPHLFRFVRVGGIDALLIATRFESAMETRVLRASGVAGAAATDINVNKYGGTLVSLGQKTMAASIPVTMASDQPGGGGAAVTIADGADVAQGTTTDADTALTVIGRLKKLVALLSTTLITDPIDRVGRLLGVVSVSNFPATQPVSGTFFQATQPVSAATLPLPTGASTETTLAALNTKMPADPAREGGNLATMAGKDFATQTTLAALLTAEGAAQPRDITDRAARLLGHVTVDALPTVVLPTADGTIPTPMVDAALRQLVELDSLRVYALQMTALDPSRGYEVR